MSVLDQLASKLGSRTEAPNRKVADLCVGRPALLGEIAEGLKSKDVRLLGDCAEVFTMAAEKQPALVVPYVKALTAFIAHKNTRVRWEVMHALSLIAHLSPEEIAPEFARLAEAVRSDASVIVRDYAVDLLGNYAKTGAKAARQAFPMLKEALTLWEGKQAGHALAGLAHVMKAAPELSKEILPLARTFLDHPRGVVRKAAKSLVKSAP